MEKQILINFWCIKCQLDITAPGKKKIKSKEVGEVWTHRCTKCGRELVRLINNPHDPYYRLSRKLRMERKKYAKDILQPGDPGFDILYPEVKRKRDAYYEKLDKDKWKETKKR